VARSDRHCRRARLPQSLRRPPGSMSVIMPEKCDASTDVLLFSFGVMLRRSRTRELVKSPCTNRDDAGGEHLPWGQTEFQVISREIS